MDILERQDTRRISGGRLPRFDGAVWCVRHLMMKIVELFGVRVLHGHLRTCLSIKFYYRLNCTSAVQLCSGDDQNLLKVIQTCIVEEPLWI